MAPYDEDCPSALTLTRSLLCRWRVLSPTGNFLSSAKESHQRTPQGTDGSLTSFALLRQIRKPLNVALPVLLPTPLRQPFPSHFVPAKRGAFCSPLSLPLSPHHLLRQKRGTSSNSPRCFRHRRRHGEFLETASLHPPLAARRLFPLSRLLFCIYRITFFFRFIFYHRQKLFLSHSPSEWFS